MSNRVYKLFIIIPLIILPVACLAISSGSTFRIVTDEPIEDIVVECIISKDYLIAHNARSYSKIQKVLVVKSNENASCGMIFSGSKAYISVYHPTYTTKRVEKGEQLDHIVYMSKSVEILDELEQKSASGNRQSHDNALDNYVKQINRLCAFAASSDYRKKYLKAYAGEKKLDYQHFKTLYYNDTLACLKKQESIRHQLKQSPPYVYFTRSLSQCLNRRNAACKDAQYRPDLAIEKQLNQMWSRETWFPYLAGNEEQRNRSFGKKKTYLVAWNDPKGGGTWFLIDAYSKVQIKKRYPEFVAFDDKPKWMSDSQKKRFVKNCDGSDLHWDIEKEPTGWLYDYSRGVIKDIICK